MSRGMLWVGTLLLAVTGCGRSGVLEQGNIGEGDSSIPLPHGDPNGPVAAPTSTPIDAGRGLDGPMVFDAGATEIDECVVLESGNGDRLELLGDASLFDVGRRILVVQMNDAIGHSGPTTTVGQFERAGQWEIAEIKDLAGSTATLVTPLVNAGYATNAFNGFRAQVCLVREYTDVTVSADAEVAPRAWDGNRGGVIAWMASGTVDIQASGHLGADASGFRGGMCGLPASNENVSQYDVNNGYGGGKGEGLDSRYFLLYGRGAVTNGGGGGNGLNAGGGGGGGAGRGGIGGGQTNATGNPIFGDDYTRGFAGGAAPSPTRLIFGGGGGAGHLNGIQLDRCGGAGGGILLLSAQVLIGAGTITANGETAPQVERDGGGGGGAGGTIEMLVGDATVFAGTIAANGGQGGNVQNSSFSTYYGPGGGGGGGTVRAKGVSATVQALGGREGWNTTNSVSWDADDGEPGVTLYP